MGPAVRVIILSSLWLVYTLALILVLLAIICCVRKIRRRLNTTQLLGPARNEEAFDIAGCASKYGSVFSLPRGRFERTIVLCDAAAIEHFYAQTPNVYQITTSTRRWTGNMVGRGLSWVDGRQHAAYRKVLSPLFSNSAVDGYAPIFLTMAIKVKNVWDEALASRPRGMVVEISHWMNSVVLDSLGSAGFGHDFGSLSGEYCPYDRGFLRPPGTHRHRFGQDIPFRTKDLALALTAALAQPSQSYSAGFSRAVKCLAEDPAGELRLSHDEVVAQVNTWLFSGFETTAGRKPHSFWLLIELAKHPEMQDRLRVELRELAEDAEYQEIARLPYLHSVVPVQDDIIPLSAPIATKSGVAVNSLKIAKGTHVTTFDPERWWNISAEDESDGAALSGRRITHLAFGDGGRACIGAGVALGIIKVVVFVLVRRYAFALPHGLGNTRGVFRRAGGEAAGVNEMKSDSQVVGTSVMMVVRKLPGVQKRVTFA
ncbi:cytochrome P450 [Mycena amicta]|nr:cytochrome P450 [Mycena amicta]